MEYTNTLQDKARKFAHLKHEGQEYGTDMHFKVHTDHVCRLAILTGQKPAIVIAALLHDVLEDTSVTYSELENEFGSEIAQIVLKVTDNTSLPKPIRKYVTYEHMRGFESAIRLKLIDRISNLLQGTLENNPKGIKYINEMEMMREMLYEPNMCDDLWDMLSRVLARYENQIALVETAAG